MERLVLSMNKKEEGLIMEKSTKVVVILTFIVLVAIVISFLIYKQGIVADKNVGTRCDGNEECVKVQTTCCPCSMGGTEKCVLKEEAENYRVNESECPQEQVCPAVYNCEEDCRCRRGNCSFVR